MRHLLAQVALDLLGHLLKEGAGGAAAAGTRGDLRGEAANAHRLQNLLRDRDLFGAIAVRRGRERDANGVADAFLQHDAKRRGAADDALRAHARFGQAEMQRILAAAAPARDRRRSGPARR